MPNAAQDPVVDDLRARITAADAEIVAAVNRRASLVAELHAHKRAQGYDVFDPAREEQVIAAALQREPRARSPTRACASSTASSCPSAPGRPPTA